MKRSSSTLAFDEKGFTLLEVLIAITLLAFISLGVVDVTENALQTKERTTQINKNNLQVETALSRFEWDFSQIYSPLYFSTVMNLNQNTNNFSNTGGASAGQTTAGQTTSGQSTAGQVAGAQAGAQAGAMSPYLQQYYQQLVTRFEVNEHFQAVSKEGMPIPRFYAPDKSTFEFFTSSNRRKIENTKQSHFAWVRYALAPQDPLPDQPSSIPRSLKSFVRYFTAEDPYNDKRIDPENIKGAVLLRNVEKLEFEYWNFNRRKWETSLRAIPQGENMLTGVKLLITWYDGAGNERTTTRIFRTHWPLTIPQDMTTATLGNATTGNTTGTTTDGTTNTSGGTNGF